MKTLSLLKKAIENGLDNSVLSVDIEPKNCTFKEYIGDFSGNGKHQIDDKVPAGVIIWNEDNFIGLPDTVFTSETEKVAFYELSE
jgi:hypothetical protein